MAIVWERFSQILEALAQANANVTILVLLGVAATFKGVFDEKGISDLGKLVYHISLPCLLLVNILYEVTVERLRTLWVLPFFCLVHVTGAYVFTHALSRCLKLSDVEHRPVMATVMFGNVGALTIAIMEGLCTEEPFNGPAFGGEARCISTSTSYIAFYLITQNILMFTWGERILIKKAQEAKAEEIVPVAETAQSLLSHGSHDRQAAKKKTLIEVPSLSAMQGEADEHVEDMMHIPHRYDPKDPTRSVTPGRSRLTKKVQSLSDQDLTTLEVRLTRQAVKEVGSRLALDVRPWSAENHGGAEAIISAFDDPEEVESPSKNGGRPSKIVGKLNPIIAVVRRWSFRRCYRGTRRRLILFRRALRAMAKNPPLQAAILALILGLWPPLKQLFVSTSGEQAPLRSAYVAIQTLGSSQVPVSMLMLSGSGTLRYLKKQERLLAVEAGAAGAPAPSFSFTRRAISVMILGRLLGVPALGYVSWYTFKSLGLMPSDPLLSFIVVVESAVPSAQNVVMLLLVHGELTQGAAMAEIILWQYAVAIPIFTLISSVFAYIIFQDL